MAPSQSRSTSRSASAARSTVVNHFGAHPGDHSFLLVRERGKTSASESLALHGAFDAFIHERLHQALLELSGSRLPLLLDLRGICTLDESFLRRLLKMQRDLTGQRVVSFQIAPDGPLPPLIRRLGLEKQFGLKPSQRLPKQPLATLPQAHPLPQANLLRRTQWATNENR